MLVLILEGSVLFPAPIVEMSSSEIEPGYRYLWLSQICLNRFWLFKEIAVRTVYHIALTAQITTVSLTKILFDLFW